MALVVEVDGEGFEQHVHTWWDLVEPARLDAHLDALRSGALAHPSGATLVDVFLEHASAQDESARRDGGPSAAAHAQNARALQAAAVRVVTRLQWGLEDAEAAAPERLRALCALVPGWLPRWLARQWARGRGEWAEVEPALAHVRGAEAVAAWFVAGRLAEARASVDSSCAHWQPVLDAAGAPAVQPARAAARALPPATAPPVPPAPRAGGSVAAALVVLADRALAGVDTLLECAQCAAALGWPVAQAALLHHAQAAPAVLWAAVTARGPVSARQAVWVRHLRHEALLEWLVAAWSAAGETAAADAGRRVLASPLLASTSEVAVARLRAQLLAHVRVQAADAAALQ